VVFVGGGGAGAIVCGTTVVPLPERWERIHTLFPSALARSARGSSANTGIDATWRSDSGSKTSTCRVVIELTNALLGLPANTMSPGSSSICSVAFT
jgi:hypothetical protein